MTHEVQIVKENDCCRPDCPPPPSTDQGPCEGDIQLAGRIVLNCECCRLVSRTFIVNIGPQSEANLITFLQNTVNAYEAQGYVVLAHSLVDTGAGWVLGLSVGWYV